MAVNSLVGEATVRGERRHLHTDPLRHLRTISCNSRARTRAAGKSGMTDAKMLGNICPTATCTMLTRSTAKNTAG
jgi:hypothetical protein